MSLAFSPSDTIPVTYHAFGEYGFPTFGFLSLAKTRGVDRILDFNPTISVSYRNFFDGAFTPSVVFITITALLYYSFIEKATTIQAPKYSDCF